MAQVVRLFEQPVVSESGVIYEARACGRLREDENLWEGWIEFVPADSGEAPIRSPRETTQSSFGDVVHWANTLSSVYLEGALHRAEQPATVRVIATPPAPVFDEPARRIASVEVEAPTAVLDPYSVGEKGEAVLRRQLLALEGWHLRNIIRAYDLYSETPDGLELLTRAQLAELIVEATRGRAAGS